jgi:hypothetical protein
MVGAAWTIVIGGLSHSQTFPRPIPSMVQRFGPILPGGTLKNIESSSTQEFPACHTSTSRARSMRPVAPSLGPIECITFSCPIGTPSATRSTISQVCRTFSVHTEADLLLQACLTGPRSLPAQLFEGAMCRLNCLAAHAASLDSGNGSSKHSKSVHFLF